jgi:hypothetical protein
MNEQQRAAVKQAVESMMDADRLLEDEGYGRAYQQEAITALQSIISQDALDKMAENARELGLDYEPARQDVPETNFGNMAEPGYAWPTIEQRAVIQQMVDALDHADELLGGNDTLVMNGAAAGRWLLEQPAVQEPVKTGDTLFRQFMSEADKAGITHWPTPPAAQPAAQEPIYQMQMMDGKWIDQAKQSYEYNKAHGHTVRIVYTTPPAPQPVPVKTYHDGKPWPVAPKPWVGLTDEERNECTQSPFTADQHRAIEAKLKEKNT